MPQTSITINSPIEKVWQYFITPANWEKWWSGGLLSFSPEPKAGAKMIWKVGLPSTIVKFVEEEYLEIEDQWMLTIFEFRYQGENRTLFKIYFEARGGASFNDGGQSHLNSCAISLDKFKRLLEGEEFGKEAVEEHAEVTEVHEKFKCDICGNYIVDIEGYLLNLEEIVSSKNFWEKFVPYSADEGGLNKVVDEVTSRVKPWLVCNSCFNLFNNVDYKTAKKNYLLYKKGSYDSRTGIGGKYKLNLHFDFPKPSFIRGVKVCKVCKHRSVYEKLDINLTCDNCGHSEWGKILTLTLSTIILGFIGYKLVTAESFQANIPGWFIIIYSGFTALFCGYSLFRAFKGLFVR
ncbi:MAG: SRPBCC family protein [Bacteroidota bacterium]